MKKTNGSHGHQLHCYCHVLSHRMGPLDLATFCRIHCLSRSDMLCSWKVVLEDVGEKPTPGVGVICSKMPTLPFPRQRRTKITGLLPTSHHAFPQDGACYPALVFVYYHTGPSFLSELVLIWSFPTFNRKIERKCVCCKQQC